MTAGRFAPLVVMASLVATAGFAQTHAQLLEKGIFFEETAGDVEGAIRLYRQVVSSREAPRDVIEVAQWRLAETLRRSQRPQVAPAAAQQPADCCGIFSGNYDTSQQVTVVGVVRGMQWTNPQSVLMVDGVDGNTWGFTMPAPNALVRGGITKNVVKLGDQVLVTGYLATGKGETCPSGTPTACAKIVLPSAPAQGAAIRELVHASASTITSDTGAVLFDRTAVERAVANQQQ